MKSFKRLIVSVVALSLTISLTGCGIIRQMMSILNGSYPEEVSTSEPTSYEKVETMIGKDGGVVKDEEENVTISIPQGALSEDTNISAQYIEEPSYLEANPSMNFLGAVEFGPSGTTFDKPVEVSLQLTDTPKHNKISIFCYSEEYDQWDFVTEADVNYNVVTFSISHFSKYKALDMTMSMLMKFHDLVRQALATGQPDSWILENFKKYLIEEEHIMDIYALYGGYWYEPCGLIVYGNYHINGKEGDPNQLVDLVGKTNLVGNTYGLCHDGQLVVDVQTYKKIEGEPKEGQEIISSNIGVYYEMIKPDIDLTASKTKLAKGESATINIRCHYTNVTNYFDEFKDLDMDGYMLTIVKPVHFDIDKIAVVTKEGRESFVVTAKEDNVAETITVNFDVSGDHGVHAEGNITLNSEGFTFEGHIVEEFSITYNAPLDSGVTKLSDGFATVTVEYDFEGHLSKNKEDDGLSGVIRFSNVQGSIANSVPFKTKQPSPSDPDVDFISSWNYFEKPKSNEDNPEEYPINGFVSDGMCSVFLDPTASSLNPELEPYAGAFWFNYHLELDNGNNHQESNSGLPFYLILTSNPILDFEIGEKEEQTQTVDYLKDSTEIIDIFLQDFNYTFSGESTTQTIIVG